MLFVVVFFVALVLLIAAKMSRKDENDPDRIDRDEDQT